MEITKLESILTDTIGFEVNCLKTNANEPAATSYDLFDPFLYAYSGLAKIQGTFEIVWSLQKDDSGWMVQYQDVVS